MPRRTAWERPSEAPVGVRARPDGGTATGTCGRMAARPIFLQVPPTVVLAVMDAPLRRTDLQRARTPSVAWRATLATRCAAAFASSCRPRPTVGRAATSVRRATRARPGNACCRRTLPQEGVGREPGAVSRERHVALAVSARVSRAREGARHQKLVGDTLLRSRLQSPCERTRRRGVWASDAPGRTDRPASDLHPCRAVRGAARPGGRMARQPMARRTV